MNIDPALLDAARREGRLTEGKPTSVPDAPSLTEEQFLQRVLLLAKANGWKTAHFRPGRTGKGGWRTAVQGDGKGFPDLILCRGDGELIFAELKRIGGRPTPEQAAWLEALTTAHPYRNVYLWTPDDWPEIELVLR